MAHPLCTKLRRGGCLCCFLFKKCDFCETNYLNIYRTNLHEICMICRTLAVDEQSEVIFYPSRDVAVATNFVAKSTSNTGLVVRMTFTRAAPPAYDKNDNCYAGRRHQTHWTQANQLTGGEGDKRVLVYRSALPCI